MTNVTPEQFKGYWEIFFQELKVAVERYLPSDTLLKIKYLNLMQSKITAIVSSQFGVAAKFMPADKLTVDAIGTHERIEDVIFDCPKEFLRGTVKFKSASSYLQFKTIMLKNFFPFRLTKKEASIAFSGVLFEVGYWSTYAGYTEIFGNNDYENWSPETAKNRALELVLAALYDLKQAEKEDMSIEDYVAFRREKSVLLLGDYGAEGKPRLEKVRQSLLSLGYRPTLIEEVPDDPYLDLLRKVAFVSYMCRFVVVEDSSKSGHLAEVPICEQNHKVTILLRAGGKPASYVTVGLSKTNKLILEKDYDPASPTPAIKEATQWAEEKLSELKIELDPLYPWRKP